jgi:hypothetical protein
MLGPWLTKRFQTCRALRFLFAGRGLSTNRSGNAKSAFGYPSKFMALAEDLLAVADRLRSGTTEADWRRSASSSYYSAFHLLVDDGMNLVLNPSVPHSIYRRSIAHVEIIRCAEAFAKPNNLASRYGFNGAPSADLVFIADNIPKLRGWRIDADYEAVKGFGQSQANDAFDASKKIHEAASNLRKSADHGYICMLAAMLIRKPQQD